MKHVMTMLHMCCICNIWYMLQMQHILSKNDFPQKAQLKFERFSSVEFLFWVAMEGRKSKRNQSNIKAHPRCLWNNGDWQFQEIEIWNLCDSIDPDPDA